MKLDELKNLLDYYRKEKDTTSRAWIESCDYITYENEYIVLKRVDTSNKWLGTPHNSEMEKMWSIIVKVKKDFTKLTNYQNLKKIIKLKTTPVKGAKSTFAGCYGIRLYGLKKDPSAQILNAILNYIFS